MAQQCTVNMGEDTNTLYFRNQGVAVSLGKDQPDEKPGNAETLSKRPSQKNPMLRTGMNRRLQPPSATKEPLSQHYKSAQRRISENVSMRTLLLELS